MSSYVLLAMALAVVAPTTVCVGQGRRIGSQSGPVRYNLAGHV